MKRGRVIVWTMLAIAALSLSANARTPTQPVQQDLKPGSMLVFPLFDIRPGYQTELRITNTHPASSVNVQLNYVCPGSTRDQLCRALDRHIALTGYGSQVINVADHAPPCREGFVVAFAENAAVQGEGIPFDFLIGSSHIRFRGAAMSAQAIAIQSAEGAPATFGDELDIGTTDYVAAPSHLHTDFRASQPFLCADGTPCPDRRQGARTGSELILLTLDTIAGQHNPATSVDIDFFNENEVPFSTSYKYVCWGRTPLHEIDLNFTAANLGTATGSMVLWPAAKCPVPGGCPPLVPFDPAILGVIVDFNDDSNYYTLRNLFHDMEPKATVYVPR